MTKHCLFCGKTLSALKIKNSFGLAKYCTSACGSKYRYLRDYNPDKLGAILDKVKKHSGTIESTQCQRNRPVKSP